MPLLIPRALLLFLLLNAAALPLAAGDWRVLAPGLELREFRIPDRLDDLN